MNKKESASSNISFISLMTALNVIFVLISRFLPFSAFILMIILPITTVLVTILCQKKYILIYSFSCFILCLIASPADGLYYTLSTLLSGVVFGVCINRKLHYSFAILFGSLTATIINFITLPLIEWLFDISVKQTFMLLLNIPTGYIDFIFPFFIAISSILQCIFSFLITYNEVKKYNEQFNNQKEYRHIFSLISLICSLLAIGLSYVYMPLASICITFAFLTMILTLDIYFKKKIYWLFGLIIFIYLILFASLYTLVKFPTNLNLLVLLPILFAISTFTIIFIIRKKEKKTINNEND
ncbi:MAG: DUF2232 domain-containing protein [Bacilli bacterium]|nr:DUF2232 domain-containing protein [Bacilli bacterium]